MSLLEKCIEIINKQKNKYKKVVIPETIVKKNKLEDIYKINKILQKYYNKHTYLASYNNFKRFHSKVDKLPEIITTTLNKEYVFIKFFDINGSFVDLLKNPNKYTTYDTGSRYGNRLVKIVDMTKTAIETHKKIMLDLTECKGGDLNVFLDAFSSIIGSGLMFYYVGKNASIYCYYRNGKLSYSNKQLNMKRIKPHKEKYITIAVNDKTASSGEYLTMIIKNTYPKTKIVSKNHETAGYLTITSSPVSFVFNNKKYNICYTIAPYIYDSDGKKYNGKIKLKKN